MTEEFKDIGRRFIGLPRLAGFGMEQMSVMQDELHCLDDYKKMNQGPGCGGCIASLK
jgi:hypothetical protein